MAIGLRRLHPLFVAEVSGVDAAQPLAPEVREALARAIDEHAVLVLRDQRLDDTGQMDFARQFGELVAPRSARSKGRRLAPELADISNLDEAGRRRAADDPRRVDQLGNRLWHTDGSFRRVPSALSMLYAHRVPGAGGETEFADMRAAWDALPGGLRDAIDGLVAEHDIAWSRAQLGFTDLLFDERQILPAVPQRLVRRHPGSGRRSLYVAAHAERIVGWPLPEGRLLIAELIAHATQPRFVYSHAWRVGDLVIWDNRCTMHRGRPFDETEVRDLRRVSTRDVGSTLEQAA